MRTQNRFDLDELRARFAARDFFVDFLGGLVPGILFLLGISAALGPPLYAVVDGFSPGDKLSLGSLAKKVLESTRDTPNFLWIALFLIAVGLAYVIGHLFYRQDPKVPNKRSFRKLKSREIRGMRIQDKRDWLKPWFWTPVWHALQLWKRAEKNLTPEQREALCKKLRTEFACTSTSECQFPYPYLADYLQQRGLDHLLPFVTWNQKQEGVGEAESGNRTTTDVRVKRSKTYINTLKIRLRHHHQERVSVIIRNEAHVRLASSTWYATKALQISSYVGFGLFAIALVGYSTYSEISSLTAALTAHLSTLAFPLGVLVLGMRGRSKIERFLHYQRLREVFYVLETAYTAFRTKPDLLKPPFEDLPANPPKDTESQASAE